MSRVVHFELLAEDPEALAEFYHKVFGWQTEGWSGGDDRGYWLVDTGDAPRGINGGIMGQNFPQSVICTIEVNDLHGSLIAIHEHGGKLIHGPNDVGHVGRVAYCEDPQGIVFAMIEPSDRTAGGEAGTNGPPNEEPAGS